MEKTMQYKLIIEQDDDPQNCRTEWDNCATFAFFHSRYNLGDKDHGIDHKDYSGWDAMEAAIIKAGGVAVTRIYMYDHSGITISTSSFSCPWDSGVIGFAFIPKAKLKTECPVKIKGKAEKLKWAQDVIESEIKTYDQYLRGDVYCYRIEDEEGEVVEACSGFYGEESAEEDGNAMLRYLRGK